MGFPTSPSDGDRWLSPNGIQYQWASEDDVWNIVANENNFNNLWGMRNALINGAMRIDQRVGPFAAIANGAYSLDRWLYLLNSETAVHTITQDSDAPTDQFNTSLKLDCTVVDGTVGASNYLGITQMIEGYNFRKFVGQTATLSFWVQSNKTGTFNVSFHNYGGDRSYVVDVDIDSASTWEKKTITLDFDDQGGTWKYDTDIGLQVAFMFMVGSTFHTTADAWQTGNYLGTAACDNWADHIDNNVWITGVQLELGNEATPFEFVDFGTELARCQRYYNEGDDWGSGLFWVGYCVNGSNYYNQKSFTVEMRIAPTVTLTNNDSSGFTATSSSASFVDTKGFREGRACTGTLNIGYFLSDWTASAEL